MKMIQLLATVIIFCSCDLVSGLGAKSKNYVNRGANLDPVAASRIACNVRSSNPNNDGSLPKKIKCSAIGISNTTGQPVGFVVEQSAECGNSSFTESTRLIDQTSKIAAEFDVLISDASLSNRCEFSIHIGNEQGVSAKFYTIPIGNKNVFASLTGKAKTYVAIDDNADNFIDFEPIWAYGQSYDPSIAVSCNSTESTNCDYVNWSGGRMTVDFGADPDVSYAGKPFVVVMDLKSPVFEARKLNFTFTADYWINIPNAVPTGDIACDATTYAFDGGEFMQDDYSCWLNSWFDADGDAPEIFIVSSDCGAGVVFDGNNFSGTLTFGKKKFCRLYVSARDIKKQAIADVALVVVRKINIKEYLAASVTINAGTTLKTNYQAKADATYYQNTDHGLTCVSTPFSEAQEPSQVIPCNYVSFDLSVSATATVIQVDKNIPLRGSGYLLNFKTTGPYGVREHTIKVTINGPPPITILSVQASSADGNYSTDEQVSFEVTFSGPVNVAPEVGLRLNTAETLVRSAYPVTTMPASVVEFVLNVDSQDLTRQLTAATQLFFLPPGASFIGESGETIDLSAGNLTPLSGDIIALNYGSLITIAEDQGAVNLSNQATYLMHGSCAYPGKQVFVDYFLYRKQVTCGEDEQWQFVGDLSEPVDGVVSIHVEHNGFTADRDIEKDTTRPAATIDSPAGGHQYSLGETIDVSGGCSESSVIEYEVIDGSDFRIFGSSTCAPSYAFSVNPVSLQPGPVTVNVIAVDSVGNRQLAPAQVAVEIVTTAPTVYIDAESTAPIISAANQANFQITGQCGSGATGVKITSNGGSLFSSVACSGGVWSTGFDYSTLADGAYNISAVATSASLSSGTDTITVFKDTQITALYFKHPEGYNHFFSGSYSNKVEAQGSVVDENGDLAVSASYYLAAGTSCSAAENDYLAVLDSSDLTLSLTALADGEVVLCLSGFDASGNELTIAEASKTTWIKDTIAPSVVRVYSPASGSANFGSFNKSGDGSYVDGDQVLIAVEFSEPVNAQAANHAPRLELDTLKWSLGATENQVVSVVNSATLTYSGAVANGFDDTLYYGIYVTSTNSSPDLDYLGPGSLLPYNQLNYYLRDQAGNRVDLRSDLLLPEPGEINSLSYNQDIILSDSLTGITLTAFAVGIRNNDNILTPSLTEFDVEAKTMDSSAAEFLVEHYLYKITASAPETECLEPSGYSNSEKITKNIIIDGAAYADGVTQYLCLAPDLNADSVLSDGETPSYEIFSIDSAFPRVIAISSPQADGVYKAGDQIEIDVQFDRDVFLDFQAPRIVGASLGIQDDSVFQIDYDPVDETILAITQKAISIKAANTDPDETEKIWQELSVYNQYPLSSERSRAQLPNGDAVIGGYPGIAIIRASDHSIDHYSSANGLASNKVTRVVTDYLGRIFAICEPEDLWTVDGYTKNLGGGLSISLDGGLSWAKAKVSQGLPSGKITSVYVDELGSGRSTYFGGDTIAANGIAGNDRIYVGTLNGMAYSDDNGASWIAADLSSASSDEIYDIKMTAGGKLLLATAPSATETKTITRYIPHCFVRKAEPVYQSVEVGFFNKHSCSNTQLDCDPQRRYGESCSDSDAFHKHLCKAETVYTPGLNSQLCVTYEDTGENCIASWESYEAYAATNGCAIVDHAFGPGIYCATPAEERILTKTRSYKSISCIPNGPVEKCSNHYSSRKNAPVRVQRTIRGSRIGYNYPEDVILEIAVGSQAIMVDPVGIYEVVPPATNFPSVSQQNIIPQASLSLYTYSDNQSAQPGYVGVGIRKVNPNFVANANLSDNITQNSISKSGEYEECGFRKSIVNAAFLVGGGIEVSLDGGASVATAEKIDFRSVNGTSNFVSKLHVDGDRLYAYAGYYPKQAASGVATSLDAEHQETLSKILDVDTPTKTVTELISFTDATMRRQDKIRDIELIEGKIALATSDQGILYLDEADIEARVYENTDNTIRTGRATDNAALPYILMPAADDQGAEIPFEVDAESVQPSADTIRFVYTIPAGYETADLGIFDLEPNDTLESSRIYRMPENRNILSRNNGYPAQLELLDASEAASLSANKNIIIDSTPPQLTSVVSLSPDGDYTPGERIDIAINFDENIDVIAPEKIKLELASMSGAYALYQSHSASRLVVSYLVDGSGQASALEYSEATRTTWAMGAGITDAAGNEAETTLPAIGQGQSLADSTAITISATPPTVTRVFSLNDDGVYGLGDRIRIGVEFDQKVYVGGSFYLAIDADDNAATEELAEIGGGSGTKTLEFIYVVKAGDETSKTTVLSTKIEGDFSSGALKNSVLMDADSSFIGLTPENTFADQAAIGIDTVSPRVMLVESLNYPVSGTRVWGRTNPLYVNLVFSEAVLINEAAPPSLPIDIGGTVVYLDYLASNSNLSSGIVAFKTIISAAYSDDDSISLAPDRRFIGIISDAAGNTADTEIEEADATRLNKLTQKIGIDTTLPSVTRVEYVNHQPSYKTGDELFVKVIFSEPVNAPQDSAIYIDANFVLQAAFYSRPSSNEVLYRYLVEAGKATGLIKLRPYQPLQGIFTDLVGNVAAHTDGFTPVPLYPDVNSLGGSAAAAIDTSIPNILSLSVPSFQKTFGLGEEILVQVEFSESINVSGSPVLPIEIHQGGSNYSILNFEFTHAVSNKAYFSHTVAEGEYTDAPLAAAGTALNLSGGQITDSSSNQADLAFPSPGLLVLNRDDHHLYFDARELSVVEVSAADGAFSTGDEVFVNVTFQDKLAVDEAKIHLTYLRLIVNSTPLALDSFFFDSLSEDKTTARYKRVVASGDSTDQLAYVGTSGLNLSGAIRGLYGASLSEILPSDGSPLSLSASSSVELDTTPPGAFTIASPSLAGANFHSVEISASSDAVTYDFVYATEPACDGPDIVTARYDQLPSPSPGNLIFDFNPLVLAPGVYHLCVTATDNVGLRSAAINSGSFTVTVDGAVASTSFTSRSEGETLSAPAIATTTISGTCSHVEKNVEIKFKDSLDAEVNLTTPCGAGLNFSASADLSALADGSVVLSGYTYNDSNVAGTTEAIDLIKDTVLTVSLDTYPPKILRNNYNSVPVSGSCSDEGRDVTVSVGLIDLVAVCTAGSYSLNVDTGAGTESSSTISVSHDDLSGLAAATAEVSLDRDLIGPDLTISSADVAELAATNLSSLTFDLNFADVPTSFSADDLTLTGPATKSTFSVISATQFSLVVLPSGGQGEVSLELAAGVVADGSGNTNYLESFSFDYDSLGPTPTLAATHIGPPQTAISNGSIVTLAVARIYIEFDEDTVGMSAENVTTNSGSLTGFNQTSAKTYEIDLSGYGQGGVTVSLQGSVTDSLGNSSALSQSFGYTFDTLAPFVSLSSTDITADEATVNPVSIVLTVSEDTDTLQNNEVTATGGSITNWVDTAPTYSFTLTASGAGPVSLDISAATLVDSAGNTSDAFSYTYTFDDSAPEHTIVLAAAENRVYATDPEPTITINWSRPVTGSLDISEILVTKDEFLQASMVTGVSQQSATSHSVNLDFSSAADGDYLVTVASGSITDLGGTILNSAGQDLTVVWDTVAPAVGTLTIANADISDEVSDDTINVNLFAASPDNLSSIDQYYLTSSSQDCSSGGSWLAYTSSAIYGEPIANPNALNTVCAKLVDHSGNESGCSCVSYTHRPPVIPAAPATATAVGSTTQIKLTHPASVDIADTAGYIITRSRAQPVSWLPTDTQAYTSPTAIDADTKIVSVTASPQGAVFYDGDVSPGDVYYYKVWAFNSDLSYSASPSSATAELIVLPSLIGDGTSYVTTIKENSGYLYVAGSFQGVGDSLEGAYAYSLATKSKSASFPAFGLTGSTASVYAAESDGAGGYWVGGNFDSVGGSSDYKNLVHLNADFSVDTTIKTDLNGTVKSITAVGTTIYFGGSFTSVSLNGAAASTRNRAAALDSAGPSLLAWDPNLSSGELMAIEHKPVGTEAAAVYLGGSFSQVGGASMSRLAAVNPVSGALLTAAPGWASSGRANADVRALLWEPTGERLYIGGSFTSFDGSAFRSYCAALLENGTIVNFTEHPRPIGSVYAIEKSSDGIVYFGGAFTGDQSASGESIKNMAAYTVNPDDRLDFYFGFQVHVDGRVNAIGFSADGSQVLAAGFITTAASASVSHFAAFNANTGLLVAGSPRLGSEAFAVTTGMDGPTESVMVGGEFSAILANAGNNLFRMNLADLSVDPGFSANFNNVIEAIEFSADGATVYVGGKFSTVNGSSQSKFAPLDASSGDIITGYSGLGFNGDVLTLFRDPATDYLYVGGKFSNVITTTYESTANAKSVRLTPSLTFDQGWLPPTNSSGYVDAISVHPLAPDRVFLGGRFSQIGGSSNYDYFVDVGIDAANTATFAKPITDLGLDSPTSYADLARKITSMHNGADFILVTGSFYNAASSGSSGVVKIDLSTPAAPVVDSSFKVNVSGISSGGGAEVNAVAFNNDTGNYLIGGSFTEFAGNPSLNYLSAFGGPSNYGYSGNYIDYNPVALSSEFSAGTDTVDPSTAIRAVYYRSGLVFIGGDFNVAGQDWFSAVFAD